MSEECAIAEVSGVRKAVAIAAAVVLFMEALGIALLNWIMGIAVHRQRMSLAGLDPDAMSVGTWVFGAVGGLFLATVAVVLLRAGIRDRAPGRFGRILVIGCAVVHGAMGALSVGLAGWGAFAGLMAVLGLLVLSILHFAEPEPGAKPEPGAGSAEPGPTPA